MKEKKGNQIKSELFSYEGKNENLMCFRTTTNALKSFTRAPLIKNITEARRNI